VVQGKNFSLDNDLRAEGDRMRSFIGEAGATVGRNIELKKGRVLQPYLRAAWAHEFAKNNEVKVNNNVFDNELSGSRIKLATGVAMTLTKNFHVHADFDYSNGRNIEQPLGIIFGGRYEW
jgi:outer membrane autotransporter protein